nr:uncharacterized protein LOC109168528 [Ipomoea trifida]
MSTSVTTIPIQSALEASSMAMSASRVHLHLLRKPFTCSSRSFGDHELTQNLDNLQFIWGKKSLSDLSTWGIGGRCKIFVQVFNQTQLLSAVRYCRERSERFLIVGKGSNCLFDDEGFDGCVILNRIDFLEKVEPGVYRVGSGYPFNRLGVQTASEGFTGLEFAGGVPGTVGGAAYMNAGANTQEAGDCIHTVEIITTGGQTRVLGKLELDFGYRSSPFQGMKDLASITAVTFKLKFSQDAKQKQMEYLERRKRSQPLGERTAGSVFRNPSDLDVSAGELIERAGLKGFRIGEAMVSERHANFFINRGGATSHDMLELIAVVKEMVHHKFGVQLREEVLYIQ